MSNNDDNNKRDENAINETINNDNVPEANQQEDINKNQFWKPRLSTIQGVIIGCLILLALVLLLPSTCVENRASENAVSIIGNILSASIAFMIGSFLDKR